MLARQLDLIRNSINDHIIDLWQISNTNTTSKSGTKTMSVYLTFMIKNQSARVLDYFGTPIGIIGDQNHQQPINAN